MEQILHILEENARISLEDLAAIAGRPAEEVARQLDEWQEQHIINGYKALIDWDKTGAQRVQAIIELRVSPKRDCGFDEIASTIARFDEVDSVLLMSGGYDLAVFIEGKNLREVAAFVSEKLSVMDKVLSTATHFILKKYKDHGTILEKKYEDTREKVTP